MESNEKLISIIIPAYNEEKNIPLIYHELQGVFSSLPNYQFEIIFVNDGSADNSWAEIEKLATQDKTVRGISFSRNFGHQAAIEAGLESAKGDAVIMMDGDLQHPPALIPNLVENWEKGFHIVNTKRLRTEKESIFKKITSKIFYWLINKISDIHLDQGSADFRLLDKKAVMELARFKEKDKFYRGLVKWIGFRVAFVEYEAGLRSSGKSSYTLKKMLTFARIGITSFSMLPMKIIILLGSGLFSIGTILLLVMLYYRWFVDVGFFSGNAILAAFIIVSNGFIIMIIGILSVYQMTMFKELKNRPNYIISEEVNSNQG
ncbi:MAG: glycosyltransferase family 2 protein [Parcubacteria group bacterium]|jgi:dolichol-phosphate mannosyltransferase